MCLNIYTIGYASRTLEDLIKSLKKHNINALVDVRSLPYSSYFPMFNREELTISLKEHNIKYIYLGHLLGPRSDNDEDYLNNQIQFKKLQKKSSFNSGIERIIDGANKKYHIAMMCAEKEHLTCHRNLLIGDYLLSNKKIDIKHILFNNKIEYQSESIIRLADELNIVPDMFKTQSECNIEAYDKNCLIFAYRKN